ncbi:hypothetical protein TK12N_15210 [Tetragenococcus koreensis]|uniref:Uncharacterized protein n=1 Tax=Tetragenococcus koreensis TaxID=290335 RepID=A0AAN4UC68_9ENTE|nr:hypothetical protein TKO01_02770 [Tetragenococcus koreensis]GEQ52177.1 hypothetical protein TK12N_15210 [Tetragenococcus koreensis]GEQ54703.1 hypothetical protein TK2N_15470 [Tetragenococcus koreensis]GEQ59744.1 hypothetical protein TK6N_15830 [Tetragenococcus koreensis]
MFKFISKNQQKFKNKKTFVDFLRTYLCTTNSKQSRRNILRIKTNGCIISLRE